MSSRPALPSLGPILLAGLALLAGQMSQVQAEPPIPPSPSVRPAAPSAPVAPSERPFVALADNGELAQLMLAAATGHGYLGVQVTELNKALCDHFGVDQDGAVLVAEVETGSPAEAAGLQVGDILTTVDDKAVRSAWSLRGQIAGHEKDDRVVLELWRDGRRREVDATLDERKATRLDLGNFWFSDDTQAPFAKGLKRKELKKLRLAEMPNLPDVAFFGERYANILEKVQEKLNSKEFVEQMKVLSEAREKKLEQRLKTLEERLQELDKRLEKSTH